MILSDHIHFHICSVEEKISLVLHEDIFYFKVLTVTKIKIGGSTEYLFYGIIGN